jgi:L-lactate utilization protein LutC
MSEARNESPASLDARDAILASIRQSLAASRPFDAEHQKHHRPSVPPITPTAPVLPLETLIENFRSSLAFVGADCRVVQSRQEAADEAQAVIESHSAKRIAVSDSSLMAELMPNIAGIEVLKNAAPSGLFDCDLGITSAQWGIGETGTLVLESERESHRLTSLVPPVHLCILRAADIRQTLSEILELINKDLSRTVTFITGASRTSDIELTLAIGVHGPKELHVIVIND